MSDAESQPRPEKKKRSPVERIIVWGLIGLMGCVVLVEFLAQKNYEAAFTWLDENGMNNPKLATFRENMTGAQEVALEGSGEVQNSESEIQFKWFSFFKVYSVTATVAGEGDAAIVTNYNTGKLAPPGPPVANPNPSPTPPPGALQASGGMGGGPGGGGPPQHSEEGNGRPEMEDDEGDTSDRPEGEQSGENSDSADSSQGDSSKGEPQDGDASTESAGTEGSSSESSESTGDGEKEGE